MKDLTPKVIVDEAKLHAQASEALAELTAAKQCAITCDAEAAEFAEYSRDVARQLKEVAAADAAVCGPLEQAKKAFRKLLAPRKQHLEELDGYLRAELGRWTLAKAAEQRKQMAAAAEAANAGRTADLTAALGKVQEAAPVKLAGVSVKPVWTAVVFNANAVPLLWCSPDVKAIQEHAKKTPTDREPAPIPGVRFVLNTTSRVSG